MTRDEAILTLYRALQSAIEGNANIEAALQQMDEIGLRLKTLAISAVFEGTAVAPAQVTTSDGDFLRRLRIDPNIEVSE